MQRLTGHIAIVLFLVLSPPSQAQSLEGTLAKIAETKTIALGYRTDEPPFSYAAANGTAMGYSIDLCLLVAEGIKRHLQLDAIKIDYVPATPATRFVLLKSGKMDLECAATTNTAERRKQVAFSYPHFMTAIQFLSRRQDHMDTLQDLAGRSVAGTSGTTGIDQVNSLNRTKNLNIAIIPTRSNDDAFNLVITGRAHAFVTDGIMLAALIANAPDPTVYALSSDTLSEPEPYGLMYRHGDPKFGSVVNGVLHDVFTSEKIDALYAKWFTSPTPPFGRNLNLPMSPSLKAAFRNPIEYAE